MEPEGTGSYGATRLREGVVQDLSLVSNASASTTSTDTGSACKNTASGCRYVDQPFVLLLALLYVHY